jgi:hypothetical protein
MIMEPLSLLNNKERSCFNNSFGTGLDLNAIIVIPIQAVDAVKVVVLVKDRAVADGDRVAELMEGDVDAVVAISLVPDQVAIAFAPSVVIKSRILPVNGA